MIDRDKLQPGDVVWEGYEYGLFEHVYVCKLKENEDYFLFLDQNKAGALIHKSRLKDFFSSKQEAEIRHKVLSHMYLNSLNKQY